MPVRGGAKIGAVDHRRDDGMTNASAVDPVSRLPAPVRAEWAALAEPTPSAPAFDPGAVRDLPKPVRRWLVHTISPGTPLHRRVELAQHGRIRIGSWRTFTARQITAGLEGYVWACATRVLGVPVYGYDRLAGGSAAMVHRAFGRVALVNETGPDLTRSAAGRLVSETIWTPAVALDPAVTWRPVDNGTATAVVAYAGENYEVSVAVDPAGAPRKVAMRRWARVNRGPYQLRRFGAEIHREATFTGFTVPTQVTAGYDDDSPRRPGCAFIEITVDDATYF
jgi:hypothetical protein